MDKMIFLNTGWMRDYRGLNNDNISGGGKHVDTMGWGGEIFNFKNFNGKYYGYVEPWGTINIDNIDTEKNKDFIKGVTVIWTATRPKGGRYIVGWYKNATVFRNHQEAPEKSKRFHKENLIGYYVTANTSSSKLLPIDERVVKVPGGKNGFGRRNIWYCKDNSKFLQLVLNYIAKGISPDSLKSKKSEGGGRQLDIFKRLKIELEAVKLVTKHYSRKGYTITSVEKDNVGWDLKASYNDIELKLEVKGLSGNNVSVELTANEFFHLKKYKENYRLCIVTETLTKPKLQIFSYSSDVDAWLDDGDTQLVFEEVVSARVRTV